MRSPLTILALLTLTASPALAQVPLDVQWSAGRHTFKPPAPLGPEAKRLPITHTELRRAIAFLQLDEEQAALATAQHAEMVRDFQTQWLIAAEEILDKRAQLREQQPTYAISGDFPELREAFEAKVRAIATTFRQDLQLVLTPEQQARYDAYAQASDRLAVASRNAVYPLEAVDIEIVLGVFTRTHDDQQHLAPILTNHNSALDPLIARKRLAHDQLSNTFKDYRRITEQLSAIVKDKGRSASDDPDYLRLDRSKGEAWLKLSDDAHQYLEAAKRIAQLNQETVDQIRAALTSDAQREAFTQALNADLPPYLREAPPITPSSALLKDIETLLSLNDPSHHRHDPGEPTIADIGLTPEPLTPEQRAAIIEIQRELTRDLARLLAEFPAMQRTYLNRRASHSHDWQLVTEHGTFELSPGSSYGFLLGDDPPSDKASRETLDNEHTEIRRRQYTIEQPYKQRLRELLTLAQRAAIINGSL